MGLTALSAWLVVTGYRALAGSHEVWSALKTAQGESAGPVLLVVVAAVFAAERRWPAVSRPPLARAHLVDAAYLALFAALAPLVTLLNIGFAVEVERHAGFVVLGRLALAPQLAVVLLILIGMDAMNWAAHVANHRSAALWRFHALHHSQEDLSVFTTFRTHPLSHASYLPAVLPALVLSSSGAAPAAALIAYACFVTLPHANLRWTLGPLRRVVVSPAYHRLHHASGMRPVNFGFVLVCWDRLAGCAVSPVAGDPVATGITGRPVPVEQADGTGVVRVFAAQLAQPWRRDAALDGRS
jgi:sterol desaturase/sphingolipid hydroxylase (fatty acid hydroxylase superfamily)